MVGGAWEKGVSTSRSYGADVGGAWSTQPTGTKPTSDRRDIEGGGTASSPTTTAASYLPTARCSIYLENHQRERYN
ncbi:hypothetical protein E2C01_038666 [Portunus trituberculatus]|uniref:Uncharacterized protein n=1 Tax=Portunus trituberculatus TaxID=210409 RepID=A0A5B7FIL9_PORTR|nr:hypothetical protein [Portunus trituberculatus]